MTQVPLDVVRAILGDPTDFDLVSGLVAEDAAYVSLNYDNPDLKKLMPWAGTGHGVRGIVETFVEVGRFWRKDAFEITDMFGSGENVAVFGRFTYTSVKIGRTVTTRFRDPGEGLERQAHLHAIHGRHLCHRHVVPDQGGLAFRERPRWGRGDVGAENG